MGDERSAYAALGLDADADDAAIERAYRRLIKRHHPDRTGGDNARATELNRAYRELRLERNLRDPLDFNEAEEPRPAERNAWLLMALVLIGASLFLILRPTPVATALDRARQNAIQKRAPLGAMERPLQLEAVERAVAEAGQLKRTSDEITLAARSRACHQILRSRPTLAQFDRCAAFDAAVVQLQDRDPLRDQGPFSELAVTGRVRSAAALLSDDSVAIDARMDRIRRQVSGLLRPSDTN